MKLLEKIADEVGIKDFSASCLPEDKVKYVNDSQKKVRSSA